MNNILLWVALISFFLAIFPIPAKINLVALGLCALTLIRVLGHDLSLPL